MIFQERGFQYNQTFNSVEHFIEELSKILGSVHDQGLKNLHNIFMINLIYFMLIISNDIEMTI